MAGGECAECSKQKRLGLQTKLKVNEPGDIYEREADRIADQVMAAPAHHAVSRAPPRIQRYSGQSNGQMDAAPASVDLALVSPGRPLEPALRQDMEQRFGYDFSGVRVHSSTAAEQSARDVSANAYTVGHDIVFGAGRFTPGTHAGRDLLAHELGHVVQQRDGQPMVQRDKKPETKPEEKPAAKAKSDVAIVLGSDEKEDAEGRAYAQTVIRVFDVQDARDKLKALGVPIGTLYVISHSTSAGEVQFESSIGTISWVPITDLGKALKGATTIDTVDFRGCKLGAAGGKMESFRQQIGAQSTKGTNCWSFVASVTPLTEDGVEVTSPSQIPKGRQAAFDKALLKQIQGLQAADGAPVQNCLIGLALGEKANAKNLSKIWKLYWTNQGWLVASWASPDFNENWQKGSICTKDMTTSTSPCAIVETKAPAGGGKQGAMVVQSPQEQLAEVQSGLESENAPGVAPEAESASPSREEEA